MKNNRTNAKNLGIKIDGEDGSEIVQYRVHKKVLSWGTGGGILMPKQLIGKTVYVELLEKKKK